MKKTGIILLAAGFLVYSTQPFNAAYSARTNTTYTFMHNGVIFSSGDFRVRVFSSNNDPQDNITACGKKLLKDEIKKGLNAVKEIRAKLEDTSSRDYKGAIELIISSRNNLKQTLIPIFSKFKEKYPEIQVGGMLIPESPELLRDKTLDKYDIEHLKKFPNLLEVAFKNTVENLKKIK